MSRDYVVYWFTKYGFVLLVCFFVALVLSAIAFLPEMRHGTSSSEQTARMSEAGGVPASTISEDKAAIAADKKTLLLNISSEPEGQTVYIDFDSVGVTPIYKMRVATGVYVISAGPNFEARTDTVIVATDTEPRWIMFGPDRKVTARRNSPADSFLGHIADSLAAPEGEEVGDATSATEHVLAGDASAASAGTNEPARPDANRNVQAPVEPAERVQNSGTAPSQPRTTAADQVGTLVFESNPESAIVLLDQVLVGSTPLTLKGVPAGSHDITIKKDGYDDYSATIDVRASESLVVDASLASAIGKLIVLVEPWGSIYIDGKLYKLETDIEYTTDLVAGTHVVTATHPTLGSVSQQVSLNGGERVRVTLTFDK